MNIKSLFSNWTRVAAILLIGGALAWTIKLGVIIATDGRIITTGAASFFMKVGLIMLFVGSTGLGNRLSQNHTILIRTVAILLSPAIIIGLSLVLVTIINPIFENSQVWYAQQEAPIGVVAILGFVIGSFLYRSDQKINVIRQS